MQQLSAKEIIRRYAYPSKLSLSGRKQYYPHPGGTSPSTPDDESSKRYSCGIRFRAAPPHLVDFGIGLGMADLLPVDHGAEVRAEPGTLQHEIDIRGSPLEPPPWERPVALQIAALRDEDLLDPSRTMSRYSSSLRRAGDYLFRGDSSPKKSRTIVIAPP